MGLLKLIRHNNYLLLEIHSPRDRPIMLSFTYYAILQAHEIYPLCSKNLCSRIRIVSSLLYTNLLELCSYNDGNLTGLAFSGGL